MKSGSLTACRGVRHDYHETGLGEGGGPSARRLFTQSDESTGPARRRLTCLGRAVGTNSTWGLFFWWGVTNLVLCPSPDSPWQQNIMGQRVSLAIDDIYRLDCEGDGLRALNIPHCFDQDLLRRSSFRSSSTFADHQERYPYSTTTMWLPALWKHLPPLHTNQSTESLSEDFAA
jgi:hypothetical protein